MERRVVNVPANVEILIRYDDHPDACSNVLVKDFESHVWRRWWINDVWTGWGV